jgi:CheY-like chemotaxis protein
MNLQALLVSSDDSAADVLGRVLAGFGVALDRSSEPETTIARIQQQRFDALLVDFDDPKTAASVIELAHTLGWGNAPLTVALVADPANVRSVLSSGAHFVLYKPVSEQTARAALRPAAALLNRERRCAIRVPVQAPVELTLADTRKLEGILLDLSETGMDVLTAEPQFPGALLKFRFQLEGNPSEIEGHGQVAWANPNGQTGVHFVNVPPAVAGELKNWLRSAAMSLGDTPDETVPHCKLTDLSLGGCYVETDAPFPERALIDLCLKTGDLEVHIEGMVRVAHPSQGMGVEFPSRTSEQRAQVGRLIDFLRSSPERTPELNISPRALVADLTQFKPEQTPGEAGEELEDSLLELLRRGATLQEAEFLTELQRQRTPEDLASV